MNTNKTNLNPYLLIIISALILGFSRYPATLGLLAFIGFIPLFRYFDSGKKSNLDLIRSAALFSLVNTLVAYHWIGLVTVPGLIGIIFLFSLYYWGIFSYLNHIWESKDWLKWFGFVSIWLSFELFTFYTEFRFPWLSIGYALSNFNILSQIADLGGIHLLSFAILLSNILVYQILEGKKSSFYLFVVFLLVWFAYGSFRYNSIKLELADLKIKMMQPSIDTDKFDLPLEDLFAIYEKQSYYASLEELDLFIWPEAAITEFPLRQVEHGSGKRLKDIANKYKLNIFFGTIDALAAPKNHPEPYYFYNTATLLRYPDLTFADPYYKMYLVPVGERMPYLNIFPFLWKLQFGQANWEFGKEIKYYTIKNKKGKEFTFSPQICYEIIFPTMSNEMARHGVDFIINLTNDAWFKRSIATYQHAMMTRIRAIETRTAFIRSANTGHSLVVSPNGKIETYSKLYDVANFPAPVYTTEAKSLYVFYLSWFPFIFPISALIIFLLAKFKYYK